MSAIENERPDAPARVTEDHYRQRSEGPWDRVVRVTHCVDCLPATCSMVAFVRDGVVVREEASANYVTVEDGVPDMNPMVCQKGLAWSRQMTSPDRLLHPLRRTGPRGSGEWEQISWEEAFAEIADAMLDTMETVGSGSIVYEGSPELIALVPAMRFMRMVGATNLDVNGSINDFWSGFQMVFGKFYFTHSYDDYFHSDTILIWFSNPAYTAIPVFHYWTEARYRGARVVLIAPDVNPSHSHADLFVPVAHGTDAALALAMCQVVLDEDLADLDFVASQTDLSLLVHTDTGLYLRASEVVEAGSEERFYHASTDGSLLPADPADLHLDDRPMLDGRVSVTLLDGRTVEVEPLLASLRRQLDEHYTPEQASEICGANPEVIRTLARWIAAGRTSMPVAAGLAKYFHSDLIARSITLLLGLTGNWGRKGAGTGGWSTGMFDGQFVATSKTVPGVEGAEMVLGAMEMMRDAMREADPTLTGDLATTAVWRAVGRDTGMVPPAFFWYWHAGYRDRWADERHQDPTMARTMDEYVAEALEAGWWGSAARPGPEQPPRVLIEVAGNMLRRSRGGKGVLLEHLWPQLDKIVVCDVRMSQTAAHADLVLPAAHHYEKPAFAMPTPWTMHLTFGDAAVPPAGDSRTEWDILGSLCRTLAERAAERGLTTFLDPQGVEHRFEDLWSEYTLGGALATDEDLAQEMVRDGVFAGSLPEDTTLATLRDRGWTPYTNWGVMAMAQGQSSPFPVDETHSPLRNHVELGHPYPTLTRRAQFLIEHPWFVEAGEQLPVHKDPPPQGGAGRRFRLSGGHNRWSVHSMNLTNPLLLETHRGEPFVLVNDDDAEELGIADDGRVRLHNDVGQTVVRARVTPAQRPGALTIYNGYEGFMFEGGDGPNELEPGLVKWLGFAGGYGQLTYAPTEWQPIPTDRCIFVDLESLD